MIQAICFRCGEEKDAPLSTCQHCGKTPEIERHQIRSFCLSKFCLKQDNLVRCAKRLKRGKRCPKFHSKVIARAQSELNKLLQSVGNSASTEFSSSFFDFSDVEDVQLPQTMVLAHCVGKFKDQIDAPTVGQGKTYHQIWWQVGKEISREEYYEHKDHTNELYVIFRWIDDAWRRRCVTKSEFEKFRAKEQMKL